MENVGHHTKPGPRPSSYPTAEGTVFARCSNVFFSAACKARIFVWHLRPELKSCPDTKPRTQ